MTAGPVLLVHANSIPASVVAELARLNPTRIVVLGGTGVVTNKVFEALRNHLG